ncbi:type II secretion system GspH family protein [bacterium]|nr:type II secretion system GspH family protein [bacterium]
MKHIRFNNRLAMTMIELLVTIGIAVVVLGLAFGILVESDRTTRRLMQFQAASQFCEQALSTAVNTIESAVAADNIESTSGTQSLAQMFKADQLQMLAYENGLLYRVRISQKPGEEIKLDHEPLATSSATQISRPISTNRPAGFKPTIRFAYAATTPPGQRPRYQDSWTSPGWPALIQIRVEAKVDGHVQPVALETAAIPGLVPARPAKEARP